ncbi:MAG: Ig-like domain-containing protein [Polaribacter sp.]
MQCARTGRPEGGPKDEAVPVLVTSDPPYESVDFDSDNIRIYFDEYITLKNLNKQLVVSPPLKNPPLISPQSAPSKYINIKILDTLKENTTYIFNFGNAVQDNNEGNKIESFKYVFSTGNYIDSLISKGKIKDAYLREIDRNVNVMLYRIDSSFTDSIIYKKKPSYIASTLDTTQFAFSNLQKGKYLMVALKEPSNDYIFNPKTDKIGFSLDTILLPRDSIIQKPIVLFNETIPYSFKRGKEVSKGKIQFGYVGKKEKINIKVLSKVPKDFKSISKFEIDKDTLNYWFTPFEADSLNFIISTDKVIDTTTVFLRKKKIDTLTLKASIRQILHFRDTFFIESNIPIIKIDSSKIALFDKDTLAIPFKSFLSKKENKVGILFDKKPVQIYTIKVVPNAFSDIFSHKNDSLVYRIRTKEIEDYGRITVNVGNPKSQNLIVELIDDKKKRIASAYISTSQTIVFDLLKPGKYYLRAIIDRNKNNIWDTGNYLKKRLPEKVIYYETELALRANYYLNENFTIED